VISYETALRLGLLTIMLIFPLGLVAGIACWRRGVRMAWLYVLARLLPVVGGCAYVLLTSGMVSLGPQIYTTVQVAALLEAVLLSLGLADRINRDRHERLLAARRNAEDLR